MVPATFTEIQWKADTEVPEFARKQKWLYADRSRARRRGERCSTASSPSAGSRGFVDLEGDPDEELKNLRAQDGAAHARRQGRAVGLLREAPSKVSTTSASCCGSGSTGFATAGAHEAKSRVEEAVHATNPGAFDPKLRVDYTGGIAQALDEQNGMRDDLTLATLLCTTLRAARHLQLLPSHRRSCG